MTIVAEILKGKPEHAVHSIGPETSVRDAARAMVQWNVGALLVLEGGRVAGIVSERDCTRRLVAADRPASATRVREIMSARVMYVRPQHSSGECMALMTENRLRHLPVLDGDKLVGLVSIGDLVKDIVAEQQFIIEQLEHYITGQR